MPLFSHFRFVAHFTASNLRFNHIKTLGVFSLTVDNLWSSAIGLQLEMLRDGTMNFSPLRIAAAQIQGWLNEGDP